ncbi:hypothetical protein MNB_SUP05-SYMBIONT-4-188 [hydrothermal vent metagenome]|uniref:Uncharacterized protein n=1 Tax=hydrothermal vent metagenome TaxID=652676 RepID=A0A1W1DYZ2_9ZZZZ
MIKLLKNKCKYFKNYGEFNPQVMAFIKTNDTKSTNYCPF